MNRPRRCAPLCRPEVGVPGPARHFVWAALRRACKRRMAANSVRCPRDRGESVNGGLPPPFHKGDHVVDSAVTWPPRKPPSRPRDAATALLASASKTPSSPRNWISLRNCLIFGSSPEKVAPKYPVRQPPQPQPVVVTGGQLHNRLWWESAWLDTARARVDEYSIRLALEPCMSLNLLESFRYGEIETCSCEAP